MWVYGNNRRKNNEELDQHSGTYNMQKLVYLGCKEKERMKELKKKIPQNFKTVGLGKIEIPYLSLP